MISLIAAMGNNHVIGSDNDMPWHLPKDLVHFQQVTTGNTIVMGRKTYESIGRPLPNRKNVIITRQKSIDVPEEIIIIHHLDEVFEWEKQSPTKEIFIIGGGELYKQALPFADRLYITRINEDFQGDTYFPEINDQQWEVISKVSGERDQNNPYDFDFLIYERRKS